MTSIQQREVEETTTRSSWWIWCNKDDKCQWGGGRRKEEEDISYLIQHSPYWCWLIRQLHWHLNFHRATHEQTNRVTTNTPISIKAKLRSVLNVIFMHIISNKGSSSLCWFTRQVWKLGDKYFRAIHQQSTGKDAPECCQKKPAPQDPCAANRWSTPERDDRFQSAIRYFAPSL